MADGNRMEKVDMTKQFNKLSETEKHFVRKLEEMNADRAKDMRRLRKKNLFTAVTIGLGVLGICILYEITFTVHSVGCLNAYCMLCKVSSDEKNICNYYSCLFLLLNDFHNVLIYL